MVFCAHKSSVGCKTHHAPGNCEQHTSVFCDTTAHAEQINCVRYKGLCTILATKTISILTLTPPDQRQLPTCKSLPVQDGCVHAQRSRVASLKEDSGILQPLLTQASCLLKHPQTLPTLTHALQCPLGHVDAFSGLSCFVKSSPLQLSRQPEPSSALLGKRWTSASKCSEWPERFAGHRKRFVSCAPPPRKHTLMGYIPHATRAHSHLSLSVCLQPAWSHKA